MLTKTAVLLALCAVALAGQYESYSDDSHHIDEDVEPQPYHFGYHVKDHFGEQHREEASDGHGKVKGSYGFTDEKGIHRQVHYVADDHGFRAEIKTNEPGTANQQPANVGFQSNAHDFLHFHEDISEPHIGGGGGGGGGFYH